MPFPLLTPAAVPRQGRRQSTPKEIGKSAQEEGDQYGEQVASCLDLYDGENGLNAKLFATRSGTETECGVM